MFTKEEAILFCSQVDFVIFLFLPVNCNQYDNITYPIEIFYIMSAT